MKQRIEFLDVGRGYAILTISMMHLVQLTDPPVWLERASTFGGAGVHLFFFISGFSLSLSQETSAIQFYRRRFLKIILAYYAYMVFIFLFNMLVPLHPEDGLYAFLGHIFFFRIFDERTIGSFGFPLWFIGTIVQLYLLFPLLNKMKGWLGLTWFAVLSTTLSVAWWISLVAFGLGDQWTWRLFCLNHLWEFALGMAVADLYKNRGFKFWELNTSFVLPGALAGTSIMALLAIKGGKTGILFNDIPALIGYSAVAVLFYKLILRRIAFLKTLFVVLGQYSYFYYLMHVFSISLVEYLSKRAAVPLEWRHVFIVFVLTLACTALLARAFQRVKTLFPLKRLPQ